MVRAGGDTWFFITADYAFGHALERDTADFVRGAGGRVLGQVRTPFPGTTDFSSFLLQAQAPRAEGDRPGQCRRRTPSTASSRRPSSACTRRGIKLAVAADVPHRRACARPADGAGPGLHRDLLLGPERPHPRLHARRCAPQVSVPLCMVHAGGYAAVAALPEGGGRDGRGRRPRPAGVEAVERMKAMPTATTTASARARIREDGRKLHPAYLFEVKAPAESRGALGLLQAAADHPGRGGLPPAGRGRLPAGAELTRAGADTGRQQGRTVTGR